MPKRAYIASVQIEIVVAAESEAAAKELAAQAFRDEDVHAEDFELQSLTYLPFGYEDEPDASVPCEGGSMTLTEALVLPGGYNHPDAIEKHQAKLDALKALQKKP